MRSHLLTRALRTGLAAVLLAVVGVHAAVARPQPGVRARRGFNLRAEQFTLFLVNRIACGINNIGEICVDPGNSPIGGGGFWPKGTPDQYIFNTGLQVAGIIPKGAGFSWAGDTVGAYFMDPRGTQAQGDGVTLVYNSLDPADAAAWPAGAVVRDTAVFAATLIGRNVVSQQDLWVRTWDGNPTLLSGRKHPMGVLVEERGMAWNFPSGNQDILYFIFDVTNVTASDPTVYAGLDPAIQSDVAAVGANFHDGVKAKLSVDVPAKGYRIDSVYVAFFADMDVGDAAHNFGTAVLPFSLGQTYKSDFKEALWKFPADIFSPPFAAAPGFIGVKYLRSPVNPATKQQIGLTLFSNTLNSATGFPDPVGVTQLWRYLSGNINPAAGDNPCTVANPKVSKLCFLSQVDIDTRFYQSSGPFSLDPGQSVTVVVAYVQAPAVAANITIGTSAANAPGTPPSAAAAVTPANIRNIDKAMGWVTATDANANGTIEQNEVTTVPGSLLQKSLVAQAIFDNKFLLPFAPEAPKFFLVPGNNQVTVVWQPSATETIGDPFFQIAANTASPLYDPNFRSNDVEGYRVYRGRTTGDLTLVAQFDYAGTVMKDYTGAFDYGNKCAPELGLNGAANNCPKTFSLGPNYTGAVFNSVPLSGNVVQIPPGGRVQLANLTVLNIAADTAVVGGGTTYPPLTDTGVPFAFVDKGVRSSFTYYYAVTAFDLNSVKSGPSSLESARITKTVTPQAGSGQEVVGAIGAAQMLGTDGTVLNLDAPLPTIDKATGIFSGPMPPTDGFKVGLAAFVPQILADGSITVSIDSVVPGSALTNPSAAKYYITAQGAGAAVHTSTTLQFDAFSGSVTNTVNFQATPLDSVQASRFGGDNGYSIYGSAEVDVVGSYRLQSFGRGDINGDPANSAQSGPRWWAGAANENTNTPNIGFCAPASGGCAASAATLTGAATPTGGAIAGVSIFSIQSYNSVGNAPMRDIESIGSNVTRAADFSLYWGAAGKIDSVFDDTHHVTVPFSALLRASWGLLQVSSFAGTPVADTPDGNNALLTWTDIFCIAPATPTLPRCNATATPAVLKNTAALDPVAMNGFAFGSATPATTGNGFIIYLNGHFFMMQLAALPTAGTVWHARFYSGSVTGTAAAGDYKFVSSVRPPAVPGLRVKFAYTASKLDLSTGDTTLLAKVHTVPDPYYATNALEISPSRKVLKFVNLPGQCIVRIYSLSGVLVQVLTHNDVQGGGEVAWDLRNRNQQFVASGVYFYHVETPDHKQKTGRFTVVNFAQ